MWREFVSRINFFSDQRNWITGFCFGASILLAVPFTVFIVSYFTFPLLLLSAFYSYIVLNVHGTVYLHRYSSHEAFQFRNGFWVFVFKNLVIKIIPEEIFVVSHYVHHAKPEFPGDPYNVLCGWLYCFLADVNHQSLATGLSREDYARVCRMLEHTGVPLNTYEKYQKWGSASRPLATLLSFLLNWIFWFAALSLIGGPALAFAIFSGAFFWAIAIRNFNFKSHGSGKIKHRDGIEFHRKDLSMNLKLAGFAAGEWHNNHHLYPRSARSGFLPWQLDFAWIVIHLMNRLKIVTGFQDDIANFQKAILVTESTGKAR